MRSYRRFLMLLLTIQLTVGLYFVPGLMADCGYLDLSFSELKNKVAPYMNTTYLGITDEPVKSKYVIKQWGMNQRLLTVMPVRLMSEECPLSINVIFVIDTGAPKTALSKETLEVLYNNCSRHKQGFRGIRYVQIAGKKILVHETPVEPEDVKSLNILGADFMMQSNARLQVFYQSFGHKDGIIQLDYDVQRNDENDL